MFVNALNGWANLGVGMNTSEDISVGLTNTMGTTSLSLRKETKKVKFKVPEDVLFSESVGTSVVWFSCSVSYDDW